MTKPGARVSLLLVILSLASLAVLGCQSWSQRGAKGVGDLPEAGPNETNFSPYQPAQPYQQIVKGLLGRKLHATNEAGVAIEVQDFLVGPEQKSESYSLPAAAIFQVKSGSGVLNLEGKTQKIEAGTVVSVPASAPFTIDNQTETPIAIRATILGSK